MPTIAGGTAATNGEMGMFRSKTSRRNSEEGNGTRKCRVSENSRSPEESRVDDRGEFDDEETVWLACIVAEIGIVAEIYRGAPSMRLDYARG